MSTATSVPETYKLEGDDALETLRRTGWARLAKDALQRFRYADGTSHSRALAFQVTLTLLPGMIAAMGLATTLHAKEVSDFIKQTTRRLAPGPAGDIFLSALRHGEKASAGGGKVALVLGLIAALVSGTFAMAQVERGANRIYGVERDRPAKDRYLTAFRLAVSAGLLIAVAFVILVAGSDLSAAFGLSGPVRAIWQLLQWPLSIAFVVAATALLFQRSPRRRQPAASWLAVGSAMSVLLWFLFTFLLAVYLSSSKAFGETYGPLIGVIGMLLWTLLTSLAVFLGLALAAQLEAVRAGTPGPVTNEEYNPRGVEIETGRLAAGGVRVPRTGV
ncbi:MAG TPA: YihY/virulence factor BrkB family protein [Actinomycetota bacterium]|jgi:YihY family inner membrane protein